MATISTKKTGPQIISDSTLTLEKKGSIILNKTAKETQKLFYAALTVTGRDDENDAIVMLNGNISVTDKANGNHDTCGFYSGTGSAEHNENIILRTDNASKITVSRTVTDTALKEGCEVSGICAETDNGKTSLTFGGRKFQDAVTVTASDAVSQNGQGISAYGIHGGGQKTTFEAELAGAVSATASSKSGSAAANGIYNVANDGIRFEGALTGAVTVKASANGTYGGTATAAGIASSGAIQFDAALNGAVKVTAASKADAAEAYGIAGNSVAVTGSYDEKKKQSFAATKDVTATASGTTARANGFLSKTSLLIGKEDEEADFSGAVTVKATANGQNGTAAAAALSGAQSVLIYGDITKAITATAESKHTVSGTAEAYGMDSDGTVTIEGKLNGIVKTTATAKADNATAVGISGNAVIVTEGLAKDMTATATAAADSEGDKRAFAAALGAETIRITGEEVTTAGKTTRTAIAGNLTAKATGSAFLSKDQTEAFAGNAEAAAIHGTGEIDISGDIAKTLNATATANSVTKLKEGVKTAVGGTAEAYGIVSDGTIGITGSLNGAIKTTATAKANDATAIGIKGTSVTVTKGITKDITATATATATAAPGKKTATAIALDAAAVHTGTISGNLTAKATGNSYLSKDKKSAYAGDAVATAIRCTGGEQAAIIRGGISKNLTATAIANSVTKVVSGVRTNVSGSATAIGIEWNTPDPNITGDITGKITATATAKANQAAAIGISAANELKVKSALGTVSATATGSGNGDCATAVETDALVYGFIAEMLTGKLSATCKTGKATGLKVGAIQQYSKTGEKNKGTASLDITANGATACGIEFTGDSNLTLTHSTITAKGTTVGASLSLYDGEETAYAQDLTLDHSSLTGSADLGNGGDTLALIGQSAIVGDVNMGEGNDKLELRQQSKIIGDVDMGGGDTDALTLYSGSLINGNVSHAETATFMLSDISTADDAMWEGTGFCESNWGELTAELALDTTYLDTSAIMDSQVFALLKDTDGTNAWDQATAELTYWDEESMTSKSAALSCGTESGDLGGFSYKLEAVGKNATVLQVTMTRL